MSVPSSPQDKDWIIKTLRQWLWLWVEETALTLTSVRNVLGRFSLCGLLLSLQPDLSQVQLVNTLTVPLLPPLCFQTDGKENIFWCQLRFHTTMQDDLIWVRHCLAVGPILPSSPSPLLSVLLITSEPRGQYQLLFPQWGKILRAVARVWAVCILRADLQRRITGQNLS